MLLSIYSTKSERTGMESGLLDDETSFRGYAAMPATRDAPRHGFMPIQPDAPALNLRKPDGSLTSA